MKAAVSGRNLEGVIWISAISLEESVKQFWPVMFAVRIKHDDSCRTASNATNRIRVFSEHSPHDLYVSRRSDMHRLAFVPLDESRYCCFTFRFAVSGVPRSPS